MSTYKDATADGHSIFVCGASRSGTALMRSILNRAPEVFLAGETHYFDDLRQRLPGHGSRPVLDGARQECEDYFLALAHRPYGHGGDPGRSRMSRVDLRRLAADLGGTGDAYFEAFCRLSASLEPEASTAPVHWGEKTPRHVFRLPEILSTYPDAVAICIYRDPRAVVASYRDWENQGGFDLETDEGHREALEEERRRTRSSYDPTIASLLWRATAAAGREAQQRFGQDRVLLVRYEDLVTEPEATVGGITARLGVTYHDGMLDVPLHNSSFSSFDRRAGVSTAPLERWKTVLSPHETAVVQRWCAEDMRRLGYEVEPVALSWRGRLRLLLQLPLSAVTVAFANRHRMGKVGSYVWRRARLVLKRN